MSTILGIKNLVKELSSNVETGERLFDVTAVKEHSFTTEPVAKLVHGWLADKEQVKTSGLYVPEFDLFALYADNGIVEVLNDEDDNFIHSHSFIDNVMEARAMSISMCKKYTKDGIAATISDGMQTNEYTVTQEVTETTVTERWYAEGNVLISVRIWELVDGDMVHKQQLVDANGEPVEESEIFRLMAA